MWSSKWCTLESTTGYLLSYFRLLLRIRNLIMEHPSNNTGLGLGSQQILALASVVWSWVSLPMKIVLAAMNKSLSFRIVLPIPQLLHRHVFWPLAVYHSLSLCSSIILPREPPLGENWSFFKKQTSLSNRTSQRLVRAFRNLRLNSHFYLPLLAPVKRALFPSLGESQNN